MQKLFSYLLKQIHRGFRVLVQEVVKDQQNASQVKGHSLELGVYVCGHLGNGLRAESEDSATALFWQVVEDEQQQLEVLDIKVFLSGHCSLQSVLLQRAHKPGSSRGKISGGSALYQ